MTRARDIADLVDANGDIVAGALDNVPAADLVNDTTPQLGGNLDAQSNDISNAGAIGVGTTAPTNAAMDVIGTTIVRGTANGRTLQLKENNAGFLIEADTNATDITLSSAYSAGNISVKTAGSERMRISSGGIVTTPNQPFFAAAWNQSATGFVTGTYGVIHNNGGFTQTNGKIYVPTAGWYFINAYGIATDQFDTRCVVNTTGASPFLFDFRQSNYSGGTHHGCGNGRVVYLASGSYVGIYRLSNTMYASSTTNSPHNLISIMLMG